MSPVKYILKIGDENHRVVEEKSIISHESVKSYSVNDVVNYWCSENNAKPSIREGTIVALSSDPNILNAILAGLRRKEKGKTLVSTSKPEASVMSTGARVFHEKRLQNIVNVDKVKKESPAKKSLPRDKNHDWIADQLQSIMNELDQVIGLEKAGEDILSATKKKLNFMLDAVYIPPAANEEKAGSDLCETDDPRGARSPSAELVEDFDPTPRRYSYKISSDEDDLDSGSKTKKKKLNPVSSDEDCGGD